MDDKLKYSLIGNKNTHSVDWDYWLKYLDTWNNQLKRIPSFYDKQWENKYIKLWVINCPKSLQLVGKRV